MKRIVNFSKLIINTTIFFTLLSLSLISTITYARSPDIPVGTDEVFVQSTSANEIKIMSYNLLNLFDAQKDAGKDDWQWLPKNTPGKQKACLQIPNTKDQNYCSEFDWTYEKVDWKLNQIKKVVTFQGSRPDMLAVMEVENENVIRLLAAKLGYQYYIITNGPDKRGIDVGLMFNLRSDLVYVNWQAIPVYFKSKRPGRDILRVDFQWKGKPLSVYVNHWASQRNPTDERLSTAQAFAQNIDLMTKSLGPQWSAVAIGDFNTIDADRPHPFNDLLHNPRWPNHLYDAELYARQSKQNPSLPFTPPGSYYYIKDDTWNRLDRIFVTRNLIDRQGMEFAQESFRLLFPRFMSFMVKRYNSNNRGGFTQESRMLRVPYRYNFDTLDESRRGYSDHLPVVFKLRQ